MVIRDAEGRDHYYDIAVIDSAAASYLMKSAIKALEDYEDKKRKEYSDRVAPLGSFTPLVCSIYGTLAPAAATVAQKVARGVDPDRDERDATLDLHAAMMQAAVVKATNLCLRARSWAVLPAESAAGSLEDAASRIMSMSRSS